MYIFLCLYVYIYMCTITYSVRDKFRTYKSQNIQIYAYKYYIQINNVRDRVSERDRERQRETERDRERQRETERNRHRRVRIYIINRDSETV